MSRTSHVQLIVGIICMHNWWTEVKKGASQVTDAIGDALDGDRRLLEESQGGVPSEKEMFARRGVAATGEERQTGPVDKARPGFLEMCF